MKHSMLLSGLLVAAVCVMSTGCRQVEPQKVLGPSALTAEVVAHYYKSNSSTYMTSQVHDFDPDNGYFQMTASEPTGPVQCRLDHEIYSVSGNNSGSLSDLPQKFFTKELATAVLYSYSAAAGLLDSDFLAGAGDDVKIEGQWYSPFILSGPTKSPEVTLYRSSRTNRIELIQLIDEQNELAWLLRSYNFHYNNEFDRQFPRSIDVFNIGNGFSAKELMIRFDYKNARKVISEQL